MPKISIVASGERIEKGDIIIFPPSIKAVAGHSAVAADNVGYGDPLRLYESNMGKKGKGTQGQSFDATTYDASMKGATVFRIGDVNPNNIDPDDVKLREAFNANLESTSVKYSIGKVAINSLRDWFSSESTREKDVAERVAKYYFKNHRNNGVTVNPANNFCSQYTVQCLQNALVENKLGKESLGVGEDGVIPEKDFEKWREKHIEQIREEVKKFPPELKHVSSSCSPTNLKNALESLSKNNEQDKAVGNSELASKGEKGFFSRLFSGMKSLLAGKKEVAVKEPEVTNRVNYELESDNKANEIMNQSQEKIPVNPKLAKMLGTETKEAQTASNKHAHKHRNKHGDKNAGKKKSFSKKVIEERESDNDPSREM